MGHGLDAGVAMSLVKSPTLTAEHLARILCSKRPDAPPGRIRRGGGDTGGSVVGTPVFAYGLVLQIRGFALGRESFLHTSLQLTESCAPAFHDMQENKSVSCLQAICLNALYHSNNES